MLARQIAVGFGIAFIFPLLVYYGVATFYQRPKYETIVTARVVPTVSPTPEQRQANEEQQLKQREQQQAYNAAAKDFAKVLVVSFGVAAILIGAYLALHSIGTGLIFGGIFTVAWGYWGYWQYLDDWVRFVSLLAGFAILIFVGYRRIAGARTSPGPV